MTSLIVNVLLNALLVGLLSATILYCLALNRRIKTLQDSKSELASLLKQFDESTVRASETIVAMQTASKKIGDNIQLRIDKANYLLDDLSYAIEKGTRLTSQIEASFAVSRARSKVMQEEGVGADMGSPHEPYHAPEPPAAEEPAKTNGKLSSKKNAASIEAILEKVVSRKQQIHEPQQAPVATRQATGAGRSRAEQELIDLIRSSKG